MLDYKIETFLSLCDTKSYTKTAEILHITQPTVTQHIQALEKRYNTKLFTYRGKVLSLTEKGERLRQFAISMKANCLNFERELAMEKEGFLSLHFGATRSIGEYVLAPIIEKYLKDNPHSDISLYVDNTKVLLDKLNKNEIEFALIEGYFKKSDYDYRLFKKESFIGVCGKNHRFADREVDFVDLLSERLIIREEGSGSRDIIEQVLMGHNIKIEDFAYISEIGNLVAIKDLVKNGVGISFLYEPVVHAELKDGTIRKLNIKNFDIKREFNFVYLKNSLFQKKFDLIFNYLKSGQKRI